jgi:hypothetical protein
MYNITHARRPTYRRTQAGAGGRAPGRSSDARTQGACEARGRWNIGGASKVSGRMVARQALTSNAGAQAAATHETGAGDLRSGLRSIRVQASASHAASVMSRKRMAPAAVNPSTADLPSLLDLTFRRLPSVASGKPQDADSSVFNRVGSTLAVACFGLEDGVHPRAPLIRRLLLPTL